MPLSFTVSCTAASNIHGWMCPDFAYHEWKIYKFFFFQIAELLILHFWMMTYFSKKIPGYHEQISNTSFFWEGKKIFFLFIVNEKRKKKNINILCVYWTKHVYTYFLLLVNTIRIAGRRKMFISLNWRWFIAESCTFSKYGKYRRIRLSFSR